MTPNTQASSQASFQACKPEDFQGRTQFGRMSPAQRLEWLDQALDFLRQAKQATRPANFTKPGKLP